MIGDHLSSCWMSCVEDGAPIGRDSWALGWSCAGNRDWGADTGPDRSMIWGGVMVKSVSSHGPVGLVKIRCGGNTLLPGMSDETGMQSGALETLAAHARISLSLWKASATLRHDPPVLCSHGQSFAAADPPPDEVLAHQPSAPEQPLSVPVLHRAALHRASLTPWQRRSPSKW